ncbi:MAG: ABC transporter ATP-binding protein [Legionellales bacterium]|nr:ABC transporter ATP-binding protein [Legionellales bacterium]
MKALEITDLTKIYKNGVQALDSISFDVREGDFFALLGPNGAGKSTTIGIISSLVTKTSGSVKIFEHDLDKELDAAKRCIGLVPQEFNFNIFETAQQVVVQQAGYYGVPRKIALERSEYYLNKLGILEKKDARVQTLSGGMKRRLMIVRALLHEPRLLILDEPTAGVDIDLRRTLWEFLGELNQKGITIILTTHYLEEAESMCRNIAIIDHGRIIENTSKKILLQKLNSEIFIFYLQKPIKATPILNGFTVNLEDETTLSVEVHKNQQLNDLFNQLTAHNIVVHSMRNKTNRLEELFVKLTSKGSI